MLHIRFDYMMLSVNAGVIALQLVRQLLEQYNLRESLAVLEAEAGLNVSLSR